MTQRQLDFFSVVDLLINNEQMDVLDSAEDDDDEKQRQYYLHVKFLFLNFLVEYLRFCIT